VRFDGLNNTAYVVALRDILPGEELTHSYIENDNQLQQRSDDLKCYGFQCTCSKCELESKELKQ
jgi:hypothetical protein